MGCGNDIKKGYINLDEAKLKGVDIAHNLEKIPYPFKKDFFDEIYASHVLEHLNNFTDVMKELHRISKKNAIIRIKCPYFASVTAFHPTHHVFFTTKSFNYFSPKSKNNYMVTSKFIVLKKKLKFARKNWPISKPIEWFVNLFQDLYERFFCFIFPMQEIEFELKVIK